MARATRIARRWFPWLVIGAGFALRLNQLLSGRAFWADEAWVAILVTERSYQQFFTPLGALVTPPAMLVLTKVLTWILGASEPVMRAIPFVAGVLVLPVFYRFARHHAGRGAAIAGLVLLTVSSHLVYYSAELKQYSLDLFVGAGLAILLLSDKPLDRSRSVVLSIACASAVWFSYTSVFLIVGYGLSSVLLLIIRRDYGSLRFVVPVAIATALSFGSLYLVVIAGISNSPYLLSYWRNYFAPFPITSGQDLYWYYRTAMYALDDPMGLVDPRPAAVLVLVGAATLIWRQPGFALRLLAPVPLLLVASMLHKYPLNGRLLLFLAPTIALLLGVGTDRIARVARRWYPAVWVVLITVAVISPGLPTTWRKAQAPRFRTEVRPILEDVRGRWREGDALYSYGGWGAASLYYANQIEFPPDARIPRSEATESLIRVGAGDPAANLARARTFQRVWLVVTQQQAAEAVSSLAPLGEPVERFLSFGMEALLYEPR